PRAEERPRPRARERRSRCFVGREIASRVSPPDVTAVEESAPEKRDQHDAWGVRIGSTSGVEKRSEERDSRDHGAVQPQEILAPGNDPGAGGELVRGDARRTSLASVASRAVLVTHGAPVGSSRSSTRPTAARAGRTKSWRAERWNDAVG